MALYLSTNWAAPGAAAPVYVTTGTSIKTLLQVATFATVSAKIVEWGISFDGSAAATPGKIELVETSGAATITQSVTGDITKYDAAALANGNPVTSLIDCSSTTKTGYTASGEGTPGTCRIFDIQLLPPTGPYIKQFPLGREPVIQISTFLRIRVTFTAAVNAYCYVLLEV